MLWWARPFPRTGSRLIGRRQQYYSPRCMTTERRTAGYRFELILPSALKNRRPERQERQLIDREAKHRLDEARADVLRLSILLLICLCFEPSPRYARISPWACLLISINRASERAHLPV